MINFKEKYNLSNEDVKMIKQLNRRSMFIGSSFNYEKMQSLGFLYAMIPIINRYYTDEKQKISAYKRHFELFNTTPHVVSFIMGLAAAMEKQSASSELTDPKSINPVKVSLMGPLAGIGDSLFWGTLRVIAAGIGVSFAAQGSILGPILFLAIFNIPHYTIRYCCSFYGFCLGSDFIQKAYESGLMGFVTKSATMIGLLVVGGMTSSMVKLKLAYTFKSGGADLPIQGILDQLLPNLLPLALTFICFKMLNKGIKVNTLLIILLVFAIVGKVIGLI